MNEYTTVSFPKPLIAHIDKIVKEIGFWPSTAAFVREACVEKMERYTVRKHRAIEETKE